MFCFCAGGTIPIGYFNVPGLVCDSQITPRVFTRKQGLCVLLTLPLPMPMVTFWSNLDRMSRVWKWPIQLAFISALPKNGCNIYAPVCWVGYTCSSDVFPAFERSYCYEDASKRGLIMKTVVLAYNLRMSPVRVNQITSVYMPLLEVDVNKYFQ